MLSGVKKYILGKPLCLIFTLITQNLFWMNWNHARLSLRINNTCLQLNFTDMHKNDFTGQLAI